jgi:hypothetical protein
MKKSLSFLLIIPLVAFAEEKNLFFDAQLHWDFHREIYTSTVEVFNIDRTGTSFFFADFDYKSTGQAGSYFEVSHNFAFTRFKNATGNFSLQYNDGVLSSDSASKGIPRTLLYGLSFSDLRFGSANFEVQALVRHEFGEQLGWQVTGVWNWPIKHTPFEILGYVDYNTNRTGEHLKSMQAEPQLLWRWRSLAIGSELEISRNFSGAYTKKGGFSYHNWYTHPTVFLRVDL